MRGMERFLQRNAPLPKQRPNRFSGVVVPQMILRDDIKPKHRSDQQHYHGDPRAPAAKRPSSRQREIVLRVEHEDIPRVPLLQDDQHVVEDERRGVGHVGVHGHRREQHAKHRPQCAREPEDDELANQLTLLRLDGRLAECFRWQHEKRHEDVPGEYANRERQKAGDRAGQLLAEDVARHRRSWKKLFKVAALYIVHKSTGVGNRRQDRRGEEYRVAGDRFERDGLMRK